MIVFGLPRYLHKLSDGHGFKFNGSFYSNVGYDGRRKVSVYFRDVVECSGNGVNHSVFLPK